jgi:uncharacterized protein (UPF0332 family)
MARWPRGEAEIERLLGLGHLQVTTGAAADGEPLLAKASRTLETAASITSSDPDSALVLAYDAARYAATALLAQQGLRPTTAGGHVAVDSALRAQFGDGFRGFGYLRRRRNELEYPSASTAASDVDEANDAVAQSRGILQAAEKLFLNLGFFA